MSYRKRQRLNSVALSVVLSILVLASTASHAQNKFNIKAALRAVADTVREHNPKDSVCPPGARVHLYTGVLEEGTVVQSYMAGKEDEILECVGKSLLFFIDWCPSGHYAHPVAYAIWDEDQESGDDSGTLKSIDANWWPVIRPPGPGGVPGAGIPVFDTVASRAYPEERSRMAYATSDDEHGTIVLDSTPRHSAFDPSRLGHIRQEGPKSEPEPIRPSESTTKDSSAADAAKAVSTACPTWAVVVDGDINRDDSFDEDADGMYAVLRGHRVPEDQIYYLSPHFDLPDPCEYPPTADPSACPLPAPCTAPSATDYKQRTSYINLKNILLEHLPERIGLASTPPCDELLFFSSSHGLGQYLPYVFQKCWGGNIWDYELNEWLARVPCEKVTVVIEACKSGEFEEELRTLPTLTPAAAFPAQERWIFTSTTADGVSHRDIDSALDPNPGDVGSETIWGYIEAFGSGSADTGDLDGRISFAEAVAYARANDASIVDPEYLNDPQVYPNLPPQIEPHTCCESPIDVDLEISGTHAAPAGLIEYGAPIFLENLNLATPIVVKVTNLGPSRLDVATVKVFFAQQKSQSLAALDRLHWPWPHHPLTAVGDVIWWPSEVRQIGNTILISNLAPGESKLFGMRWNVAPKFPSAGRMAVFATVDGPKDPVVTQRTPVSVLLEIDNNADGVILDIEAD